jgi:AraC-like DNA-binding protein
MQVTLDQAHDLEEAPLHLPMPRDRRLHGLAEALIADPGDARDLADWSRRAGASERTLARLFVAETGLTFGAWRQRLRLLTAMTRLAAGEPVTTVALDLGYASPSAFTAMFRRRMGAAPTRYLRQ